MGRIFDIMLWTIIAAMAVLVVLNAGKVATLISTSGNLWLKETTMLTGTGYQLAK